MKLQLFAITLLASSTLLAQELILGNPETSVLSKVMKCEQRLSAISTNMENVSNINLENIRAQDIKVLDIHITENFGEIIGNGNYYLRFYDSGQVKFENNQSGVIDLIKLQAMVKNYAKTKRLSADIFLTDEQIKNVKLKAVHTFQLVQNNLIGSLYSDDGLEEAIRIEVDVNDTLAYKRELEYGIKKFIADTALEKSDSIHSHMGDMTGLILDNLLSRAPESSLIPALEKLDSVLPNCKK